MEIFIGNLPRYATASHLNRFFAGYGRIARFRILERELDDGSLIRYGFGVIEPEIAAHRAIARLNHKRLLDSALEIRRFVQRSGAERRAGGMMERRRLVDLRAGNERRTGARGP